jgi:hypothetical protein
LKSIEYEPQIPQNRAGGWKIASHSRQENFSRTVSITIYRRGSISSVRVTSSRSSDTAAFPPLRRIDHHPIGENAPESIALRGALGEAANVRRPGDGSLSRPLVFRRADPEFERQLLDQPRQRSDLCP